MRTILITGASGGLVQEMVKLLPNDFLILLGRDKGKLEMLYQYHPLKAVYEVDIADSAAISAVLDVIWQRHGKVDILVNNAGYGFFADFADFEERDIQQMFAVNTFALMSFSRLVGDRMRQVKKGQIVNIISMAGLMATAQSSVYSATKFAAIGFSNALRLELASHDVIVTTVNPGPIATGFFDTADPDGSYQEKVKFFLLQPERVARKIVAAFGRRKREVNLPWSLNVARVFYTLFPRVSDYLATTLFNYKSK